MAGLKKVCKLYGGITIQGVKWVWDYAIDEPVKESDMPIGSERHKNSERAKYKSMMEEKKESYDVTNES